jgi:hypothetical protein
MTVYYIKDPKSTADSRLLELSVVLGPPALISLGSLLEMQNSKTEHQMIESESAFKHDP